MQVRLFSMLLPALVVDGPVAVGGELPNKRQGAKFTGSSVSLIYKDKICVHNVDGPEM